MKIFRSLPLPVRWLFIVGVVTVIVAGFVMVASSATGPAVWSDKTPSPTTTVWKPTISVVVDDAVNLDDNSLIMQLNGQPVDAGITHPGHWDYSDPYNPVWVIDDYTRGTISYTPPAPLQDGQSYSVFVSIANVNSETSTDTWSFDVQIPPATFSSVTPADGAVVNVANPAISVHVQDPLNVNLDSASVIMRVNGQQVGAAFSFEIVGYDEGGPIYDYTQGTISYTPASLPDGNTPVFVSIANAYGKTSEHNWSFTVAAPPQLSNPSPADGATVTTRTPAISAHVTDNGTVASNKMLVDGVEVSASYNAGSGTVSYTPATPLANDASHTVQLTAYDAAGSSSSLTCTFYVMVTGLMPSPACTDCHTAYPGGHQNMSNCAKCHGGSQPVYDCRECHGTAPHGTAEISDTYDAGHDGYVYTGCEQCHNSTYSYKIPVHPADLPAAHETTTDMTNCRCCHLSRLTEEHYRHLDDTGQRYDCLTCHGGGAGQQVKDAVTNQQTNCDACHDTGSHATAPHPSVLSMSCSTCHQDSLIVDYWNPATENATHGNFSSTTDACAGCHVAHAAQSPNLLKTGPTQAHFCYLCHGQGSTSAPYDVQFGKIQGYVEGVGSVWYPSTAGGFERLTIPDAGKEYSVSGGTYEPVTSRHNVWGYADETGGLESSDLAGDYFIPGGQTELTGSGLECSSCHDPHAGGPDAPNPRLLRTSVLDGTYTGLGVEFLRASTGVSYGYRVTDYISGSTAWCGSCHSKFKTCDLDNNPGAGHATEHLGLWRHPMDVPHVFLPDGADGGISTGTPLEDQGAPDTLACLSCHRAHSTAAVMEGWATSWPRSEGGTGETSALLRMNNRGFCYNCHGAGQYNSWNDPRLDCSDCHT
ncbi:MAG: Ig-like domain-containing protein [Bacillota bacterium]